MDRYGSGSMLDREEPPDPLSGLLVFDVDVKIFHALTLVERAADVIVALERWRGDVEPQVAHLIENIQQERNRWASERAALVEALRDRQDEAETAASALRKAIVERNEAVRRFQEVQSRAAAMEQRAHQAESMLLRLHDAFKLEASR